jgi:hypothetical protein
VRRGRLSTRRRELACRSCACTGRPGALTAGCSIGPLRGPIIAAGHIAGPTTSPASCKRRLSNAAWLENLPDSLQDGATAEALRTICDLDLSELQAIIPPRGFGRD